MNQLTLAVAGGRKTQSIVDRCLAAPLDRRILVLTYTVRNQREVIDRIATHGPPEASVDVQGWFSFLLGHWVRPYLPMKCPGRRLRGLNFEGDPGWYITGDSRFLDDEGRAYKRHLGRLAIETNDASSQAVLDRLARIYDEIYVDEVQDLNGYDLVVLEALMASPIDLRLVGDIRQALLMTNVHDPKYKQYKGIRIMNWFEAQAARGMLEITHERTTWRSNQAIADFADALFAQSWGFARTSSMNKNVTGHDGMFAVAMDDVMQYVARFAPVCLRWDARFGAGLDLPFVNIAIAKGMSVERVLIVPTGTMVQFVSKGKEMTERTCCSLYVAATRARASVAIACADPSQLGLPIWTP